MKLSKRILKEFQADNKIQVSAGKSINNKSESKTEEWREHYGFTIINISSLIKKLMKFLLRYSRIVKMEHFLNIKWCCIKVPHLHFNLVQHLERWCYE